MGDMRKHIEKYAETMDSHSRRHSIKWLTNKLIEHNKFLKILEDNEYEDITDFEKDRDDLQVLLDRLHGAQNATSE